MSDVKANEVSIEMVDNVTVNEMIEANGECKMSTRQIVTTTHNQQEETIYLSSTNDANKRNITITYVLNWFIPFLLIIIYFIGSSARKHIPSIGEQCSYELELTNSSVKYISTKIPASGSLNEIQCYDYPKTTQLSQGWKLWFSLYPFISVFQGVLGYGLSSRYVAPFTLLLTIALGLNFFLCDEQVDSNADVTTCIGWTGDLVEIAGNVVFTIVDRAAWTMFEYAFNVFTAFFFLRVLQLWGVVETMREQFEFLAKTPFRKIVVVAFCFAVVIAVVAPGGSNFLIAGAILIDMNIHKLDAGDEKDYFDKRIGAICLFGNGLTSAFNLLGVCIIAIAGDISSLAIDIVNQPCSEFVGSETDDQTDMQLYEQCAA